MKRYEFQNNGFTFIRIPKNKARVAYDNGLTVLFCPVNLRPGKPWYPEIEIKGREYWPPYADNNTPFSDVVNRFEFYNCINSETGRYTAFYIPVKRNTWYTDERLQLEYDYSYMARG